MLISEMLKSLQTFAQSDIINIESPNNYSKLMGKLPRVVNNRYLQILAFIHCDRRQSFFIARLLTLSGKYHLYSFILLKPDKHNFLGASDWNGAYSRDKTSWHIKPVTKYHRTVNATAINFHVLIQVRGAYFSKYSSGGRFCVDLRIRLKSCRERKVTGEHGKAR